MTILVLVNYFYIEHGKRDDLESLGYIFVYWLKGKLPWQGIQAENKEEKYEKIMQQKISFVPEVLAKGLPIEFQLFLHYTKTIRFEDTPDYNFIKKMFENLMSKNNFEFDYNFDWTLPSHQYDFYVEMRNTTMGKLNFNQEKTTRLSLHKCTFFIQG